MSSGDVSGKNMSQKESSAPCGRAPYFMSVMNAWSRRNGPTHQASSSTVVIPTVTEYTSRVRSIHNRQMMTAEKATKISTMPCEQHAAASTTAVQTRYLPVRRPADKRPSPRMPSDSAIENENSPAIVDLRFPP